MDGITPEAFPEPANFSDPGLLGTGEHGAGYRTRSPRDELAWLGPASTSRETSVDFTR
jgi:hypothetical protein